MFNLNPSLRQATKQKNIISFRQTTFRGFGKKKTNLLSNNLQLMLKEPQENKCENFLNERKMTIKHYKNKYLPVFLLVLLLVLENVMQIKLS